ncbi:MAG TPA: hypothetical protein VN961_20460 [Streptosporangiaceae bacterium]|nr:hypothetical protein [Streptosporangiaceae bacterium]
MIRLKDGREITSQGGAQPIQVWKMPSPVTGRTHVMSIELNTYLFFPGNALTAVASRRP